MRLQSWSRRYWLSFSYVGLMMSAIFFAASLSPSLVPRIFIVQGLLSGLALAIGYGVGVFSVLLWQYLELPQPSGQIQRASKWLTTIGVAVISCGFLWRATVWQNSIRELMEMEPLKTAYPWRVALIAILFGAVLVAGARIFGKCCQFDDGKLSRFLPRRVSYD